MCACVLHVSDCPVEAPAVRRSRLDRPARAYGERGNKGWTRERERYSSAGQLLPKYGNATARGQNFSNEIAVDLIRAVIGSCRSFTRLAVPVGSTANYGDNATAVVMGRWRDVAGLGLVLRPKETAPKTWPICYNRRRSYRECTLHVCTRGTVAQNR